jgi:NADPH:quinone reductase-like Zn-dependent oxidoreductase
METMRVVSQDRYGGPEVLRLSERPVPEPTPTQVRVRVQAAGVNPVDWKTRSGGGMAGMLAGPPFVLGWDVAGVVDAVGFGVTRFSPGDQVFGMPSFPREAGAYGEFVVSPARQLAGMPRRMSPVEAAGVPLAALTAWQALVDTAGIGPGARVLVHGAAGGVGHLAVPIAKAQGAHVVGTARSSKHEQLAQLGIDESVDYTAVPLERLTREMDVILDLVGGDDAPRLLPNLRRGGLFIGIPGGVSDEVAAQSAARGLRATGMLVEPDGHGLERVSQLIEQSQLRVLVQEVFALSEASKAHALGETGRTLGKIVLDVAG